MEQSAGGRSTLLAFVLCWHAFSLQEASSFRPLLLPRFASGRHRHGDAFRKSPSLRLAGNDKAGEKEKHQEKDWKDFRAQLVLGGSSERAWAYPSGLVIEEGSIALSMVESELGCHDLRQPYLHKSAVLITEHDTEEGYTKGILLNRPSNLKLSNTDFLYVNQDGEALDEYSPNDDDDDNDEDVKWHMHYGGDTAGLFDDLPEIVFLHSIQTKLARRHSDKVLSHVMLTSHAGACLLIEAGEAVADDFYCFYGFCGWDPGQLLREVERGSWSMVATNSVTLWALLEEQRKEEEPRLAGLPMWDHLDKRIGNCTSADTQSDTVNTFSDLMLKEWAKEMLCIGREEAEEEKEAYCSDEMIFRALGAAGQSISPGMLVRGSSLDESPFLLDEQLFHKSTVLIFQDDEEVSVGLLLNCPTTETYILETPLGNTVEFPIRYGGYAGRRKESEVVWIHNSAELRAAGIGKPLDVDATRGFYTCTVEQVMKAIDQSLPADFMLVQGFSVWEKEAGSGGMTGQVLAGNFEAHPRNIDKQWQLLLSQQRLSATTLDKNIELSCQAWDASTNQRRPTEKLERRRVFQSNVKVCDLANDALRNWISVFLLDNVDEYIPF